MAEPEVEIFGGFRPVSLEVLDDRASLQRRVDNKYLVPVDHLARVAEGLSEDHEVLEIDGDRAFAYESAYFDSPALDCFWDHVRDRQPRYKLRTRFYVTTGSCVFEVKVKQGDGETVKRHIRYEAEERRRIAPPARVLIDQTLETCSVEPPPDEPSLALITRFRRVTIAALDRPERITADFHVQLEASGRGKAVIDESLAIVETKTPNGAGQTDQALQDDGIEPVSLSKYRLGTGLVVLPGQDHDYSKTLRSAFAVS